MTPRKILLLHENRLLTNFFRERLEAAGFAVESARSGEKALTSALERRPDAVVLDSTLPGPELGDLIRKLRASGGARQTPVVVLPTNRQATSEAAQRAGAEMVLTLSQNPMVDVIDALQRLLGLERAGASPEGARIQRSERWLAHSLEGAGGVIANLRRALHEASLEGSDQHAMMEFYRSIHAFAEEMAVFGQCALRVFTAQLEALSFDFNRFPETNNRSTLKTLGQAVDLLAALLRPDSLSRLKDPAAAQVLVVDDEAGARAIIAAAMELAHLNARTVESPSAGLALLAVQAFDLIFLDVGLPEMNGFELGNRIRALPLHENTPIIFITGMATFQNRVQSSLSGGSEFVGKPFSVPELGLKALMWIFKRQLGQV